MCEHTFSNTTSGICAPPGLILDCIIITREINYKHNSTKYVGRNSLKNFYFFLQIQGKDEEWFHIDPPATPEKIFLASKDQILKDVLSENVNIEDDKEVMIQT